MVLYQTCKNSSFLPSILFLEPQIRLFKTLYEKEKIMVILFPNPSRLSNAFIGNTVQHKVVLLKDKEQYIYNPNYPTYN